MQFPFPNLSAPTVTPAASPFASAGSTLPAPLQHELEIQHGVDLSEIRIHQTMDAVHLGSPAAAVGNDIYFVPGQYDPHSEAGRNLIGHEVSHVVQLGSFPPLSMASSVPLTAGDEAGAAGGAAAAAVGTPNLLFRR